MPNLSLRDVTQYVEQNIGEFHQSRLDKVRNITLNEILLSKNPYLFKAKNVTRADEFIQSVLDAFISSSEEGKFGNWLERLAIYINDSVYQGRKAGIDGIDLDFDKDGQRYLVAIKSGPNWGNDNQQKKLSEQFASVRKRLTTSGSHVNPVCVNGCCYGRSRPSSEYKAKFNYYKICGQRFWELISGDPNLYTELIIPLGHEAETKNQEFKELYGNLVNRLTAEFLQKFMAADGAIDWNKWLVFNSSFS
jgi:hypothetical protein